MQAKQEKGKQVQAQLSALRPLKTRLTVAQEAHEKANKKYKALAEEEESVKALLLAKQRFTKQAKDARDEKARELEAVEAEARIAGRQRAEAPDQVTVTDESSSVGSRTAERCGRRRKGELQPVARPIRRSSATVLASTTAGPNAD